ncbi:MAG: RrF2 family transcriptional regulator [Anaerovoracaceae bacterium]|jgi:Rrf2 family protein
MKISTKGRYALRMMVELATKDENQYTSLKDISKKQDISLKYLEQITSLLSKAHMIRSARGANGGHKLERKPSEYTVGEILRVTEGDLAPVACLAGEDVGCEKIGTCATIELWQGLEKVINDYLDGITLEDLVNNYYEKGAYEYVI